MSEYSNLVFICKRCGGFIFIASKRPQVLKDSKKDINTLMQDDKYVVAEKTTEEVRSGSFCECK
jgi:hypothetical protein